MNNPNTPSLNNADNPQDPSRRNLLKSAASAVTVTALGSFAPQVLAATTRTKESADQLPQTPEQIAKDALKFAKYTTDKGVFQYKTDGRWENGNNGFGMPTGFSRENIRHINDVASSNFYNGRTSNLYGGIDDLKSLTSDKKLQQLYATFNDELGDTLNLINGDNRHGGIFINAGTGVPKEEQISAAYNRAIAMAMVQGLDQAQLKTMLAIFHGEISRKRLEDNLPKKLQGANGLLDTDGQWGNIKGFMTDLQDKTIFEKDYSGGKTPLERARERYPNNLMQQFIYAINIYHSGLYRVIREEIKSRKEDGILNWKISQEASSVFKGTFNPNVITK